MQVRQKAARVPRGAGLDCSSQAPSPTAPEGKALGLGGIMWQGQKSRYKGKYQTQKATVLETRAAFKWVGRWLRQHR